MNIRYITASCLTVALGFIGVGTAAATTETPALTHEATPGEAATADISVTSADALAGEQLSVLILDDGADPDNPSTGDIVFIEQYVLDETGAIERPVAHRNTGRLRHRAEHLRRHPALPRIVGWHR